MKTLTNCFFLLGIILLASSCFNSEKKDINTVLDNRIKSFEQKDKNLYSTFIIDSYKEIINSEKTDKPGIIKNFELNVTPFDKIVFSKSDREIHINNNYAKEIINSSVDLNIEEKITRYSTV